MPPIDRYRRRALRWEDRRFERPLGVETAGGSPESERTVVEGDGAEGIALDYPGQPVRLTRWWLRALPPRLDGFTFIDMGSAKGRVLFVAASHGFRKVIGVEYVKELHDRALVNVSQALRGEREPEILPMLGDAGAFEFPLDPLVVHFANPFTEKVMGRVIANLMTSYERRPRPILATYFQSRVERPERTTTNRKSVV